MNFPTVLAVSLTLAGAAPQCVSAAPISRIGSETYSPRFVEKISCDIRDDDKQARCMQACDDTWIKATQAYNANIDNAKIEKKSCEAKCGC
jgi:hypothetical protein